VLAGLFYQRQTHDILQDYQIFGLADATSVNGRPGTIWLTKQFRVDKDYAAFGEASFDIVPDKLTLTGGLRAFKYNNSLVGFFGFGDGYSSRTGVAACFTDANGNYVGTLLPGAPCNNLGVVSGNNVLPKRVKGNGTTHRLNLTWKPTDDLMVYATWSRGFRPGGINRRGTIPPYSPDYLARRQAADQRRAVLGGVEEVPILLPRREQLHRDPQRTQCAQQGHRAGLHLPPDRGADADRQRCLYRRQDAAEPVRDRRPDL
jgi:hypothetical protein